MGNIQTATYAPIRGFMNSVERDVVPRDRITDGYSATSKNMVPDPLSGALAFRLGTVSLLDNGDTAASPDGVLETKYGAKSRHMFELKAPYLEVGTPACVVTDEEYGRGTLAWYDTTNAAWKQLGDDFGSGHYPTSGAPNIEFVMPPLKADAGAVGYRRRDYTRATDAVVREWMCGGSRRAIQMGGELFMGAYQGTPLRWNKRFNTSGAAGDEVTRIRPWGNIPPLWMPTLTGNAGTAGWTSGNKFYYSVMFRMADGSFTMPVIPRAANARLSSGLGLFTAGANYNYITWSNIPIGPEGTVARILLRSPQTTGATVVADPSDLRICGVINNNTQTSYVDTNSSDVDLAIVSDPVKVRFDHVWPWRSRYAWTADERAFIGYIRANPSAFIVGWYTPDTSSTVQNLADDAAYNATQYGSAVVEDQTGATAYNFVYGDISTSSPTVTTLALATYTTLGDLVDQINSKAAGSANPTFRAQLAPGADGSCPTTNLDITRLVIPCTTDGDATIVPQGGKSFANVQVGMRVGGHADIPTGTYVKSNSGGVITLGTLAGADQTGVGSTGNVTLQFGWETGDTVTSGGVDYNMGYFRNFGGAYPAVHYFKESYLDTFKSKPRGIMYTSAEPGHARSAANSFYATIPILEAPDEAGVLVGGAGLSGTSQTGLLGVACYSRAIYRIENPRGGNTALDADIRLRPINKNRGCIAPDSIVEGDGWVGYLTEDGYVMTDGFEERVVSRDIWNVGNTSLGEWNTVINAMRYETAADSENGSLSTWPASFHAMVSQGRLYCSYSTSTSLIPSRMIVYDFSPGLVASGLAEVSLGPNEAYGWSAPLSGALTGTGRFRPSCMCAVRGADGIKLYFWDDGNSGGTGDGLVKQFNVPATYTDDGVGYDGAAFTATDRCGTTLKKTAHAIRALIAKPSSGAGVTVKLIRSTQDGTGTNVLTVATAATPTLPVRYRRDVPLGIKNASDVLGLKFVVANTFGGAVRLYGLEMDYEVLESYL